MSPSSHPDPKVVRTLQNYFAYSNTSIEEGLVLADPALVVIRFGLAGLS